MSSPLRPDWVCDSFLLMFVATLDLIVQHDIRHGLPKEAALAVARKALESYAVRFADYSFTHNWANESKLELSFAVMGKRLQGSLSILPDVFRFEIDVPFAFKIFSGQAVKIIEKETVGWIEKAKSGELAVSLT